MPLRHREFHQLDNVGWLRAAVLGANDGIVSTASLVLGVIAAHATHQSMLVAGVAGLVAGAMSMATGEYVSVQSQADTEQAALAREGGELRDDPTGELRELTHIYMERGLAPALAEQVATALMAHDAIGAHVRDELGITDSMRARPLQAALASALSFAVGAALPLLVALLAPMPVLAPAIVIASLLSLALLGALAARAGGARVGLGMLRVVFWSALSMAATAGIGALFGASVG